MNMDFTKDFFNLVLDFGDEWADKHDRHTFHFEIKVIDQVRRREVKFNDELINSRYALLKNKERNSS